MSVFKRACPNCGSEISYTLKSNRTRAEKRSKVCKSCSARSKVYSSETLKKLTERGKLNKGYKHTDGAKDKIRKAGLGRTHTEETKAKISSANAGNQWNVGRVCSEETKTKIRLNRLKVISTNKFNGHQVIPSFNPKGCKAIDAYGAEHGYTFQHAMNGGEHLIEELGYWVDGYDKEKNVVIEYDEPRHKYQREKDEQRQQNITEHLRCTFIRITGD